MINNFLASWNHPSFPGEAHSTSLDSKTPLLLYISLLACLQFAFAIIVVFCVTCKIVQFRHSLSYARKEMAFWSHQIILQTTLNFVSNSLLRIMPHFLKGLFSAASPQRRLVVVLLTILRAYHQSEKVMKNLTPMAHVLINPF